MYPGVPVPAAPGDYRVLDQPAREPLQAVATKPAADHAAGQDRGGEPAVAVPRHALRGGARPLQHPHVVEDEAVHLTRGRDALRRGACQIEVPKCKVIHRAIEHEARRTGITSSDDCPTGVTQHSAITNEVDPTRSSSSMSSSVK
jgi:hypothetical protein